MLDNIKNLWNSERVRQLTDVRNIGLYIFALLVLAISWSAVKTVQSNYQLQKDIAELKEQNEVLELANQNSNLRNEYLKTDQYLELSARQNLGLAAPGEKVMLVPPTVAAKYVDKSLIAQSQNTEPPAPDNRSKYSKNIEAWRDFLLGRNLFSE